MTVVGNRLRQPKGVPVGGQFKQHQHNESAIFLDSPSVLITVKSRDEAVEKLSDMLDSYMESDSNEGDERQKFKQSLSTKEKDALDEYTEFGSYWYNRGLRSGRLDNSVANGVKSLTKLIESKGGITKNPLFWGIDLTPNENEEFDEGFESEDDFKDFIKLDVENPFKASPIRGIADNIQAGKHFDDAGFISSTTNPDIAKSFAAISGDWNNSALTDDTCSKRSIVFVAPEGWCEQRVIPGSDEESEFIVNNNSRVYVSKVAYFTDGESFVYVIAECKISPAD